MKSLQTFTTRWTPSYFAQAVVGFLLVDDLHLVDLGITLRLHFVHPGLRRQGRGRRADVGLRRAFQRLLLRAHAGSSRQLPEEREN